MEHEVITAWAGVGIGLGQLFLITWGLRQMSQSGRRRDRALDQQAESQKVHTPLQSVLNFFSFP